MEIPDLSLFRAPIAVWETTLWLDVPWTVPATPGATLVSSLRGLLGRQLADADLSPLGGYFKSAARPDLGGIPSRITLLPETIIDDAISLRCVLWGVRAADDLALLREAFARMGERGLLQDGAPTRFEVDAGRLASATVGEWIAAQPEARIAAHARELRLEFVAPCVAPDPSLPSLFGNLAVALVRMREVGARNPERRAKSEVDADAEAARAEAFDALDALDVLRDSRARIEGAERYSGTTGEIFVAGEGEIGAVWLRGDLRAAAPWVLLTALHGLGGQTSFGMGAVRRWWR